MNNDCFISKSANGESSSVTLLNYKLVQKKIYHFDLLFRFQSHVTRNVYPHAYGPEYTMCQVSKAVTDIRIVSMVSFLNLNAKMVKYSII